MGGINESSTVKKQYASSQNLSTRISIHSRYSTNKTGFGSWIMSNYRIKSGMKVLELGCGTGDMWAGHTDIIDTCGELILSDFSEGMLETAEKNIGAHSTLRYERIDIQAIPYEQGHFDAVIANMMLYHVPDIYKGLSEVRRVLKDGGTFYCATFGEHGIMEYLSGLLSEYGVTDTTNKNFTLQNGADILGKVFSHTEKLEYKDSLAVTDLNDMVDYIYSLSGMTTLDSVPRQAVYDILHKHTTNGVLYVPKEYGMFIAQ
ncbi:MAG: methyltransferase domain-containing protein [Oscillospiraceae bacterium]|nr:methyltransferase domain-containing protein [Oscillospiraceae bacterium]